MSEDYKVQVSGNMGEALIVLRGSNSQELLEQANDLAQNIDKIYDALTTAKQVTMVKEVFSAKKFGGGASTGNTVNTPRAAAPAANESKATPGGGFTCAHGAMKWLDYPKKDGSGHVKGHYCQAPRGAQKCTPIKA